MSERARETRAVNRREPDISELTTRTNRGPRHDGARQRLGELRRMINALRHRIRWALIPICEVDVPGGRACRLN